MYDRSVDIVRSVVPSPTPRDLDESCIDHAIDQVPIATPSDHDSESTLVVRHEPFDATVHLCLVSVDETAWSAIRRYRVGLTTPSIWSTPAIRRHPTAIRCPSSFATVDHSV